MKNLYTRVKQKYDSAARWKNLNPILLEGEFGVDEYGRVKVGDGTTRWNGLPYVMESFRLEPIYSSDYQNGIIPIQPISEQVIYIFAEENITLDFQKMWKNDVVDNLYFTQKKIYIENSSNATIKLNILNAEWANDINSPEWGMPNMHLYILATWIGGRIILEIIDNDQLADNVANL